MASLSPFEVALLLAVALLVLGSVAHKQLVGKSARLPAVASLAILLPSWTTAKRRPLVEGLDDPDPLTSFDLASATTRNHLYVNKVRCGRMEGLQMMES